MANFNPAVPVQSTERNSNELPANFVPEPLKQNKAEALDMIKAKTAQIIEAWILVARDSFQMDGPTLIDTYVTPKLAARGGLDERTDKFFRYLMSTIYPHIPDHQMYGVLNGIFVAKTQDPEILIKLLDGVAIPLAVELAREFDEQGRLDGILSAAPDNI